MKTLPQVTVSNTPGSPTALGSVNTLGPNPANFLTVVQAAYSNTASIWVGEIDAAVNNGVELFPGDSITVPESPARIFLIATVASQKANGISF